MTHTTLYIDFLLTILTGKGIYPAVRAWAADEMDAELRARGYITCGDCPFDSNCTLCHRGECAAA